MREAGREEYNLIHAKIRPEIHLLELERRVHWVSLYSETLGEMQDKIFDFYLRSNRIEEGRKSYSSVIGLLISCECYKQPWKGEKTTDGGKTPGNE